MVSSCGVVAKVLNSDIVVSEFELSSRYCVHFRINTALSGKKKKSYPVSIGWIVPLLPFCKDSFGIN